jgi:hypothetical protein
MELVSPDNPGGFKRHTDDISLIGISPEKARVQMCG